MGGIQRLFVQSRSFHRSYRQHMDLCFLQEVKLRYENRAIKIGGHFL